MLPEDEGRKVQASHLVPDSTRVGWCNRRHFDTSSHYCQCSHLRVSLQIKATTEIDFQAIWRCRGSPQKGVHRAGISSTSAVGTRAVGKQSWARLIAGSDQVINSRVWLLCMDAPAGSSRDLSKGINVWLWKGDPKRLTQDCFIAKRLKSFVVNTCGAALRADKRQETNHVPAWNCDSQ